MILDNTFRLFANQTRLVWKILLYQIVGAVIILGIALACCYSLVVTLIGNGFFESLANFFTNNVFNLRIDSILSNINDLFTQFWAIIVANSTQLLPLVILCFAIIGVFGSFVFALAQIPLCETIYGFMGSSAKLNYLGCFLTNFGRSIKLSLCKLVTALPLGVGIFALFVLSLSLFGMGGIVATIAPFIIIFTLVILVSLRETLFCLWAPIIVVNNVGVWKGFGLNFKMLSKNFKSVFTTQLLFVLMAVVINYGLAVMTCGVGCIFSIPATVVFSSLLSSVMCFHYNGLRYYIDKERIVSPKKLEDQERISDVKFIV